jgi:hypothetical protein
MANTPPRFPAVDIKVIGGGPSGSEAEYLSSWTNWVCNGACGKTSGRSIFRHAPLRATSSGSRRCTRWATRQTLGSMHLENVKAGSFCAWQETFTSSLQNFSPSTRPIPTPAAGFCRVHTRNRLLGSRICTSELHIGPNEFFFDIIDAPLIAPLAQLDRASGYEPEGREFESLRARHCFSYFPLPLDRFPPRPARPTNRGNSAVHNGPPRLALL